MSSKEEAEPFANNFLQATLGRLSDDRRKLDDFLSLVLPTHVDHEIYSLQLQLQSSSSSSSPTTNNTVIIVTFRFNSNASFDKACDHFGIIRDAKYPFVVLDLEPVLPLEVAIFPTVMKATNHRPQSTINESPQQVSSTNDKPLPESVKRVIRVLYEDEDVRKKLECHQRKINDCAEDAEKARELTEQLAEFGKRRQCLHDRIVASFAINGKGKASGGGNQPKLESILQAFSLELRKFDAALPIYGHRSRIKDAIRSNRVCVIVADTGSGKSTQVPQYLLEMDDEDDIDNHQQVRILCTQPRKVAAISLSHRVAEELSAEVGRGDVVGYRVGGGGGAARRCSDRTRLTFTTDSLLLREFLRDPMLEKYNCVIVDEAHERSLDTDLALGMLKRCLKRRPTNFRIIVMSATIDPKLFVEYFQNTSEGGTSCDVLTIPGRCYPIEFHWANEESESALKARNVVDAVVRKVKDISVTNKRNDETEGGAILAFLTTPAETEQASRLLSSQNTDDSLWILQLHGRLQAEDQRKVFDKCPAGKERKVVFATNSAETSITIPDVRFVVDCGLVKERRYNASRNVSSLAIGWTSKSSAQQRAGRAGRTGPGVCYRLYTKGQFERDSGATGTTSLPDLPDCRNAK